MAGIWVLVNKVMSLLVAVLGLNLLLAFFAFGGLNAWVLMLTTGIVGLVVGLLLTLKGLNELGVKLPAPLNQVK